MKRNTRLTFQQRHHNHTGGGEAPPVNDAPTSSSIPAVDVNENANNTVIDLTQYFDDTEDGSSGGTYTITDNTNPTLVTPTITGASDDELTIAFGAGQFGTATVTVRYTDTGGAYAEETVSIAVNEDVAPVWAVIPSQYIEKNGSDIVIDLTAYVTDANQSAATLTYSVVSNDNTNIVTASITDDTDLTLELTTDKVGPANITVRATDDDTNTADTIVQLAIVDVTLVLQESDNFSTAVSAASASDTFFIVPATHMSQSKITPKDNQIFYGAGMRRTVFSGAQDVSSGWTYDAVEDAYKKTGVTVTNAHDPDDETDYSGFSPSHPVAWETEDLYVNGHTVRRIDTIPDASNADAWYYDEAANTIWLYNDPSQYDTIEIAASPRQIHGSGGIDNVRVEGLGFKHYNSKISESPLDPDGGDAWIMHAIRSTRNHGPGVSVDPEIEVYNAETLWNGHFGMNGNSQNVKVRNWFCFGNNLSYYKASWGAGNKFVYFVTTDNGPSADVQWSYFGEQIGKSIWQDINHRQSYIANNVMYGNSDNGGFEEISYNALYENNWMGLCSMGPEASLWVHPDTPYQLGLHGAQLKFGHGARHIARNNIFVIKNNTGSHPSEPGVNSADGMVVFQNNRSADYVTYGEPVFEPGLTQYLAENCRVYNNTFYCDVPTGKQSNVAVLKDNWGGGNTPNFDTNKFGVDENDVSSGKGNDYYLVADDDDNVTGRFRIDSSTMNFADWQAAGHDTDGSLTVGSMPAGWDVPPQTVRGVPPPNPTDYETPYTERFEDILVLQWIGNEAVGETTAYITNEFGNQLDVANSYLHNTISQQLGPVNPEDRIMGFHPDNQSWVNLWNGIRFNTLASGGSWDRNDWELEFWLQMPPGAWADANVYRILKLGTGGAADTWKCEIWKHTANGITFQIRQGNTTLRTKLFTDSTLPELFTTQWHHISVGGKVEDADGDGRIGIYLDGLLVHEWTDVNVNNGDSGTGHTINSNTFLVGKTWGGTPQYLFGNVGHVRAYQRKLTTEERWARAQVAVTPNIAAISNQSDSVSSPITPLQVVASGQSDEVIQYRAEGLPDGLQIDYYSGRIWGTPTQTGVFNVTVHARGDYTPVLAGSESFDWTIT